MNNVLDKETMKEAIRELIHDDPEFFKNIIKSIFAEETIEDVELNELINKNFDRFDKTFKTLA